MDIEYDPFDISAQERDDQDRQRLEKIARQYEAEDFKTVMQTAQGRRFIGRLIERSGMYRTSFTGDNETFFREGSRNFGILLVALINQHCPEQYQQMIADTKARNEDSGK